MHWFEIGTWNLLPTQPISKVVDCAHICKGKRGSKKKIFVINRWYISKRRKQGIYREGPPAKESGPIAADLSFERLFLLFPATSESGQVLESELFQAFP